MEHALQNFLLHYRNTPQATTARSPAEVFLKRSLRIRFSLLKPSITNTVHRNQDLQKENHDSSTTRPVEFSEGEIVRVKATPQHGGLEKYVQGVIVKQIGIYRYSVKIGDRCRVVHLDHLRKTRELDLQNDSEIDPDLSDLIVNDNIVPRSEPPHNIVPRIEPPQNIVPRIDPPQNIVRRSAREVKRPKRLIEEI